MSDLEPLGPELDGQINVAAHIVDVLAVDRGVDGERQPKLGDPAGDIELLLRRARIGADPLGIHCIDVLEGDLDVIQAALGEVLQSSASERDGRGDQIAVKASFRGSRHDLL